MSRVIHYLTAILVLLTVVNSGTAQGEPYTDLVETDFNDPNWALVTSNLILRENLCGTGSGSWIWYEKVFNPCYSDVYNRYWKLEPCAETGRAFPMSVIGIGTFDSLYVRDRFGFQLYYNTEEPNDPDGLWAASPYMNGPQYVSLDYYDSVLPAPDGFEPGTFLVRGDPGGLADYSIVIYGAPLPPSKCVILNGSFEGGGWIDDITVEAPYDWDVNLPADKFSGYVKTEWVTNGTFNLTLYSEWVEFEVNDMATVSQEVCLTDVNHIIFDLKLDTYFGPPPSIGTVWDPNKCTAVLLIDGDVVWESNSVGSDVRDEYYNRTYTVEDKYKVAGPNTLSLGMRVNVAEQLGDYYMTQWDFIGFYDLPCRWFLDGDFDLDCYVDANDLKMFTDVWLDEVDSNDKCNLFHDDDVGPNGIINFLDFAIFADNWLKSSYEQSE